MKTGIVQSKDLTTKSLSASHYLDGRDRWEDRDVTPRVTGRAATWIRRRSLRTGESLTAIVQQLVEHAIERSSTTSSE